MLRIRMSGKLGAAFAAVALLLSASVAWAQARNAVESINFSAIQGGRTIVKIGMKEPLAAVPQAFQVTNPPRIAIDLPDTVNALGRNQVQAGEGDLRSVSIVQTPNRTRVVMNLTRNLTYTQALDGKTLVVTVEGAASTTSTTPATTAPTASTTFAEAQPGVATRYNLRDVDFRRGNSGEGRVVVDLSSASVGIDIRQQGRQLLVDFINTDVPKNLVRRLDVGDFATPVRFVDTFEQSGNARMVIEPRGLWEYSAYQTDTQFILEVKPVKEDPNRLVQSATPGYAGEKLSLNFQNVEVRAVLQVIADFTGLNIITSDTVGGNLTLRLKDVPWDQALDIILQAKGLSKRKNGNVVLIAPTDELAAKEKLALEATAAISDLEPVRTESFALSYAKAEDLRKMLTDKDQKILSKRGSATFDERTNTIFVQDTGGRLEEVRRLITQLDIPVRQVQIEARIVIADDKWGRQLGARFGTQSAFHSSNYNYGVSGSPYDTNSTLANNPVSRGSSSLVSPFLSSGSTTFSALRPMGGQPEQLNVNLPVAGAAGSLAVSILNLGSGNLVNMELSALEADNRGKVVSSPRVITADKKKAVITQGTEIPYQTASASGATTVSFKPATLELSVTPRITPDDRIIMDLDVKKDTLGQLVNAGAAGNIPAIDTRKVSTQVLVDNGDTIVLGGIFEQETRTTTNKVPFLGDIPILGNLFKRTTKQDDKTELLIFVTPKIVKESMMVR